MYYLPFLLQWEYVDILAWRTITLDTNTFHIMIIGCTGAGVGHSIIQCSLPWCQEGGSNYFFAFYTRKQPPRGDPNYDKLYKIWPTLDTIIAQFKSVYMPKAQVSIDESIIGFKGHLSFVQYMPKKPTKWGIKAWVLAESETGYVWNMKIYTGKRKMEKT